jgi:hypothetical protein
MEVRHLPDGKLIATPLFFEEQRPRRQSYRVQSRGRTYATEGDRKEAGGREKKRLVYS